MARKKMAKTLDDPNAVEAQMRTGEEESVAKARTVIRPTVQAASSLREYNKIFGELTLPGLITALSAETAAANDGDLGRGEAMLTAQAHTLDAIFNNLARRAVNSEYMNNLDTYLKLALRAQSQCRATWEALSAIKNPPMMGYVQQANIAHGHQQVNNGPSRAGEIEIDQNKVLEQNDGERLDTRTASAAGGVDSSVETVEALDRAKNR